MRENTVKVIINCPIAKVFAFTTNPKNTHLWIDGMEREKSSDFPPKIGTIYENKDIGANTWNRYKVTKLIPNRLFEMESGSYGVRYTYTAKSNNSTELEYYEWENAGELANPFTQQVLNKLKYLMETSTTSA